MLTLFFKPAEPEWKHLLFRYTGIPIFALILIFPGWG